MKSGTLTITSLAGRHTSLAGRQARSTGRATGLWRAPYVRVTLLISLFGVGFSGALLSSSATANEGWVQPLVKQVRDSVVLVTVEGRDGDQAGLGSGFVVRSDGLIATNLHVIGEARPIKVQFRDGREFWVTEVHASDRTLDLAVVRIDATDLPALEIGDPAAKPQQGEAVVAMGNPMGYENSVVKGIVSGTRTIDQRKMLQIAMPVERGNSGGPVVNRDGKVVGIVTLKSAVTANLGFAVQATDLRTVLNQPNPIAMSRWQTIGAIDPKRWQPLFGARWKKRSGMIVVQGSGRGFGGRSLCLARERTTDDAFELGVFVKLDDEAGAAGLAFGSDGNHRHYGFYPSAGRLRLSRFNGPTVYSWQVLKEQATEHYRAGQWNHLKVRWKSGQLTCFVNDQPVITHRLAENLTGRVGLAKFRDTHASFRKFQLADEVSASRPRAAIVEPLRERIRQLKIDQTTAQLKLFADHPAASRFALRAEARRLAERSRRLDQLARDVHTLQVSHQLSALLDKSSEQDTPFRLAKAALLVSSLDNPELEVNAYLKQLQQMVDEISARIEPSDDHPASADQRLKVLNQYLFQENGFHGSRTNYYHAANSYFDRVLDDREGLPLTLSILYMELARGMGLTIEGVGLPGHFVVRHVDGKQTQLLDVFDRAATLSRDDAARMVAETSRSRLTDSMLAATTPRQMIIRMLTNLLGVAQREQDAEAMLRYLEARVAIQPDNASARAMRAVVRFETGRRRGALHDLQQLLSEEPAGIDLEAVRKLKDRFESEPQ